MKKLLLIALTLSINSAFAIHSDILQRYDLESQLNATSFKDRAPGSTKEVQKEQEDKDSPVIEQQEGPEQND